MTSHATAGATASADLVRARYGRGTTVAAVAVTGGWHVAYNLPAMVALWGVYRWPVLVAACWLTYGLGVVVAARAALAGRRPAGLWVWCAVTFAVTALVAAASPSPLGSENWAWGAAGWLAILLLWQRRIRELLLFLAGTAVLSVGAVALSGYTDRVSLARTVMVVAGTVTLQLGFAGGARALRAAAQWAATAAAARAEAATAAEIAERTRHARWDRYERLRRSTVDLLRGLADGEADPADPLVRHRCAVQAGRLRRLLVERDDAPTALIRELHACADTAERRGVAVDISAVGAVRSLPAAVRRELAEPIIVALAAAARRARVTVTTMPAEVTVAAVVDTAQPPPPAPSGPVAAGVEIQREQTEGQLWVEATVRLPGQRSGGPG